MPISENNGLSGDVRLDIGKSLDRVEAAGSYATFGQLDYFTDPEVYVGGKRISTPLSENDAQRIIRASHQAPFGKGSETIVDTSVRKTWELNDTEKIPGMFATLVICLPSAHSGGAVIVRHGKSGRRFRTETLKHSYISWYSDVVHEVTEVTAGYRWVLTYNLATTTCDSQQLTATALTCKETALLRSALQLWQRKLDDDDDDDQDNPPPEQLLYLLDHKYTDASLKLNALKGVDMLKARILQRICPEENFYFCLASLERMVNGSVEDVWGGRYSDGYDSEANGGGDDFHHMFDKHETTLKLTKVVNLAGRAIGEEIDIEEDDIIQDEPFEDREPDDEDFEGYTGNEGAFATHWYRDTVIVLMPRENFVDFIMSPFTGTESSSYPGARKADLCRVFNGFIREYLRDDKDPNIKNDLRQCCKCVIEAHERALKSSWGVERVSDTALRLVVKAIALLREPNLLERVAVSLKNGFPLDVFPDVGDVVRRVGFSTVTKSCDLALSSLKDIHSVHKAIKDIAGDPIDNGSDIDKITEIWNWAVAKLRNIMDRATVFTQRDGEALVEIMSLYKQEKGISAGAISCVKRNMKHTPFVVAFLLRFAETNQGDSMERGTSGVFQDLLTELFPVFTIRHDTRNNCDDNRISSRYGWMGPSMPPKTKEPVEAPLDGEQIATLLLWTLRFKLTVETDRLIDVMKSTARQIDVKAFDSILLPFLQHTKDVMKEAGIPFTDIRFQILYNNVLCSYFDRCVGSKPSGSSNWSRPRVGCGCRDCGPLDNFLSSPTQAVGRFPMGNNRRQHLHSRLDGSGCTHVTERKGNPQTLVVTKGMSAAEAAHAEWGVRMREAKRWISKLDSHELKQLLGETYGFITELIPTRLASNPDSTTGKYAGHPNRTETNRGVKRKRVIIDLTGDD